MLASSPTKRSPLEFNNSRYISTQVSELERQKASNASFCLAAESPSITAAKSFVLLKTEEAVSSSSLGSNSVSIRIKSRNNIPSREREGLILI